MTIDIGTTPQLFIDDLIVDETHALTSTLHQPAKYAGNPIMTPLYPWEGRLALYGTVWRNDETGKFRMWYQGYGGMGIPRMGDDISDSPWKGFDGRNLLYTIGYATSDDGVFWKRPNLGLVEYEGSRDNNLVLLDAAYANIIYDPRDPNPDRLYKSLFFEARDPAGTPNMGDGVSVAFSPDGLRWTKYHGNPVITRSSDSHTLLGWDDLHSKYVSFARPSVHEGNKTRRIGRATSDDFTNWTVPKDVLVPDDDDPTRPRVLRDARLQVPRPLHRPASRLPHAPGGAADQVHGHNRCPARRQPRWHRLAAGGRQKAFHPERPTRKHRRGRNIHGAWPRHR